MANVLDLIGRILISALFLISAFNKNLSKTRQDLYERGVDIYGCYAFDFANDLDSNLSDNPLIKGRNKKHKFWQANSQQVIGLDVYSRLLSDSWKGGQFHASFTWPEAINGGPLYSYGNTLNPAGLGTRQYHGYFYTDVGRSPDVNAEMQGVRLFEYWIQQAWGKNNLNYFRIGAINPWITFNKSIVAGLFSYWAFDEPGIIGTTPSTANGPLITTAPTGISIAKVIGDNIHLKGMVATGYYDPSGGLDNRRGLNTYWDLDKYGVEILYELTYRGGTYSTKRGENGKPWFARLGGQLHTGYSLSNTFTKNGDYFFPTEDRRSGYVNNMREKLWGNSQYYLTLERMLYRESGSYNRGLTGFFKAKYKRV